MTFVEFVLFVLSTYLATAAAATEPSSSSCLANQKPEEIPSMRQLLEFIRSHGGNASSIYVGTGIEGRGVFAARNVTKDEVLIRVPRSTIFSPHLTFKTSIIKTPECQAILHDPRQDIPTALLLYIETAKRYSEFAPYFATLSEELPPTIYSFTDKELRLCADVDGMEQDTRMGRQILVETYKNFSRCIDSVRDDLVNVGVALDKLTVEHLRWTHSVVKSRSIGVFFKDGSGGRSLVPLADMFNHAPCDQAPVLQWEVHDTHIDIKAPRDYAQGEQIYECYGNMRNRNLLKAFGFTFNNCDEVEVPLSFGGTNYSYFIGPESIEPTRLLQTWREAAAVLNRTDPEPRGFRRFNAALMEGIRARLQRSQEAGQAMEQEGAAVAKFAGSRLAHLRASCHHIQTCNAEILTGAEESLSHVGAKVEKMYERCACEEERQSFLPFDECRIVCETF